MNQRIARYLSLLLLFLPLLAGCDFVNGWLGSTAQSDPEQESVTENDSPNEALNANSVVSNVQFNQENITVGTFNIQVLGVKKMSDPVVVDALVKIIRYFDVLAIQELRSVDQSIIPELVQRLNDAGNEGSYGYNYMVGPRQGRTNSTEQYVFIFDENRVAFAGEAFMVPDDQDDRFHREPMVARFRCLTPPGRIPFTFSLINIHTDPDEARQEVDALADALSYVRKVHSHEDDILVLGDLNADPDHFYRFGEIPNLQALIPAKVPTMLRGQNCNDNIVLDRIATTEFLNKAGVFDFRSELGLSQELAEKVSDHLPVYAIFSIYESHSSDIAGRQSTIR
jgi:deoxyribonuclease-1-like protein